LIKNKKETVLCVICARGGSKGIKLKNLRKINNKHLIFYPIRDALTSGVVDDIILSTDNSKIASIAKKYGAKVPFLRPKSLSKDLTTTEKTLQHALLTYEKISKKNFDICLFLTANELFRRKEWIIKAVSTLKKNKKLDSVFCGHITHKNYWEKKGSKWVRMRKWMKIYSSRQVRRFIVREDTGIACASRASLWRKGKRIGDNVEIILNKNSFTAIDIHDLNDLKLARCAMKIFKNNA
jgi:CMP-N-acetylneuraminic acid synthetase